MSQITVLLQDINVPPFFYVVMSHLATFALLDQDNRVLERHVFPDIIYVTRFSFLRVSRGVTEVVDIGIKEVFDETMHLLIKVRV